MRSLRPFIALCARILIVHTGHVRHRGGQQQRQQIVACACACEFVARLSGESEGGEHGGPYRELRETVLLNPLAALHMAAWRRPATVASGLEWKWCVGKCLGPLERTAKSIRRATLLRHADCDVKAAGGSLITELQRERRHAVIRGAVRRKRSWDALGAR